MGKGSKIRSGANFRAYWDSGIWKKIGKKEGEHKNDNRKQVKGND